MPCGGSTISVNNQDHKIVSDSALLTDPAGVLSGYMFEIFLYGINSLTFCTAAYTLIYNLKGNARWVLLTSAATMFAFSTMNVALSLYVIFGYILHGQTTPFLIIKVRHSIYFVNNLISDALLIYRCYMIWSRSVRIIIAPCVCLLASFGLGVFYVQSSSALLKERRNFYMWMALAFNVVITALIATRIWWMARETRKALGPILARRYYSAMVIIVESGAIYSLYVLTDEIIKMAVNKKLIILDAGLAQIVAIAPTLIIIQVGFGRQARNIESTMRIGRETREVVFTTVQSHSI